MCSNLLAQRLHEPFAEQKMGKEYYIKKAQTVPIIDGVINDLCWTQSIPITDFVQEDPDNMAQPTERTEVRITYDDRALYVAARLFDSEPMGIVKQLAPRDDWYGAFDIMADWFSIDLDSRHDHQTGFSFAVNASGVISDEMIYHDDEYDNDWNAIWQAEVNIDTLGWTLEMEIPFSNLPFYGSETMTWGMNFTRFIQRKYETITWVAFPLEVEGIVSKYGHLNGLEGIYPPAKFEFRPYTVGGMNNYSHILLKDPYDPWTHYLDYRDVLEKNMGLDILYRINSNSSLSFTLNPDFGHVEADPADINITAFETYYPEKRAFFLKDMDIFNTPLEIFYSRRVGEIAWGAEMDTSMYSYRGNDYIDTLYYDIPVIIKGAGKFTGKTESGLSFGLLGVVTTLDDSSRWVDQMRKGKNREYFVSRIKQDLFAGNSYIGFMSTSSLVDSAHAFSIDGMANLSDNQVSIEGQFVMNLDYQQGMYGSISFSPLGIFSGWIDYYRYDKGLDLNYLGYLWRDDYTQTKLGVKLQSFGIGDMIRNASIIIEGDKEQNSNGLDLGKTVELRCDLDLGNYWEMGGGLYKIIEHYDDRKIIHDIDKKEYGPPIFIPEVMGSNFNISTDKHQKFWIGLEWTWASNTRNDAERGQYLELSYKPNTYLTFSTSYDRYRLKKQHQWLESFLELNSTEDAFDDTHHVFSDIDKKMDILTFRVSGNINRKLSIHGYFEFLSNNDYYNDKTYTEYLPDTNEYDGSTDYMNGTGVWTGYPIYTTSTNSLALDMSYVDPNYDPYLFSKYQSFVFNGVIKWNYMKGSNLYIVYTNRKSVNGDHGGNIFSFNEKKPWTQVFRDQGLMIKMDYWFER